MICNRQKGKAVEPEDLLRYLEDRVMNFVFINHFQNIARGHFTIRRLERKYGSEIVQKEYKKLEI